MNKDTVVPANSDNAQAICLKIKQDSDEEILRISQRAKAEIAKITAAAEREASAARDVLLSRLEKEIEIFRERTASALNLEKKKIFLEGRKAFVDSVLDAVKNRAGSFRTEPGYPAFLSKAIKEGARVLGAADFVVYYSSADRNIFNEGFLSGVKSECSEMFRAECGITLKESDFADIGVIVQTPEGRMMYDNRFSARLERMRERIYMELLKEAS